MRKRLVARLVFPCSVVAGVAVWAACSGTSGTTVPDLDAGTDASSEPTDTGIGTFVPIDTGAPPVKEAGSDAPPPLAPFDAGPIIVLDGGLECYAGGEPEVESNDTLETANVLHYVRCGLVTGGSSGGESDWLTFEVPDAATGFNLYYHGQVHAYVQVGAAGLRTDITVPGQRLPFVKGQPYYVEVRSTDGGTQSWQIILADVPPDNVPTNP
jgi:hypothetical protein